MSALWKISIAPLTLAIAATAQTGDIRTRNLWNEAFAEKRPQTSMPQRPQTQKSAPKPDGPADAWKSLGDSFIGMTLWRMRPSERSDPVRFRGLVHRLDPAGRGEWTPERITFDKPVGIGDYVRLTVESSKRGYLYVVDRDLYADGAKSAPTLIFPTKRLRGGDNRVEPGVPIEIPDQFDAPPAFALERTRSDQIAVLVMVIVGPQPIPNVNVQSESQRLTDGEVSNWEREWGGHIERLDDPRSAGKAYTPVEKMAAANISKPLSASDPLPLTLFRSRPGDRPLFVSVPIKLARSAK